MTEHNIINQPYPTIHLHCNGTEYDDVKEGRIEKTLLFYACPASYTDFSTVLSYYICFSAK